MSTSPEATTTRRNIGRQPQDRRAKVPKVTSVDQWKKKSGKGTSVDVALPSGNVAKIKRMPLTKLLELDIFPDSLQKIMVEKTQGVDGAEGKDTPAEPDKEALAQAARDPKELAKLFHSVDRMTALVVVEPAVQFHKELAAETTDEWIEIPDEDRDEDALYTDEVDLQDKLFIFQFCVGGSSDLDSFRAEFGEGLGDMENL